MSEESKKNLCGVDPELVEQYEAKRGELQQAALLLSTDMAKQWAEKVLPLIEQVNVLAGQCVEASPEWWGSVGYRFMAYHPTPPNVEAFTEEFLLEWVP